MAVLLLAKPDAGSRQAPPTQRLESTRSMGDEGSRINGSVGVGQMTWNIYSTIGMSIEPCCVPLFCVSIHLLVPLWAVAHGVSIAQHEENNPRSDYCLPRVQLQFVRKVVAVTTAGAAEQRSCLLFHCRWAIVHLNGFCFFFVLVFRCVVFMCFFFLRSNFPEKKTQSKNKGVGFNQ
jgi:hypothetical protein